MEIITALVLLVLLLPILFLAFLGWTQLNTFLSYNSPLLPVGSPGEAQKGLIIRGEHPALTGSSVSEFISMGATSTTSQVHQQHFAIQ